VTDYTRDHLSDDFLLRHLDGELPQTSQQHLEGCGQCRARMARMRLVSGALEDYSASLTDSRPADRQREALLLAMRQSVTEPPGRHHRRALAAVLLACAAAVVLGVGIRLAALRPPASPVPSEAGSGFIALPYSDENLSPEGAVVLEVELPRSALLLAGMPAVESHSNGRIKAEVVVGADGLARAIRFLN
jgi:hypothetical protein